MADEKIPVEPPEHVSLEEATRKFKVSNADIPDYFANISNTSIGTSEITLFFGRQLEELTGESFIHGLCRVTLSHDNFLQMIAHWNRYAVLLATAYGDEQPTLRAIEARHPDRWQKALEVFQQPPFLRNRENDGTEGPSE